MNWIKRYTLFHNKHHPNYMATAEIETFLTHHVVAKNVAILKFISNLVCREWQQDDKKIINLTRITIKLTQNKKESLLKEIPRCLIIYYRLRERRDSGKRLYKVSYVLSILHFSTPEPVINIPAFEIVTIWSITLHLSTTLMLYWAHLPASSTNILGKQAFLTSYAT